ncbi:MAG: hypothetical protein RBS34_15395 [Desulfofustis sp.]|nr:hypothetical protein [Desulfofustis sp.]
MQSGQGDFVTFFVTITMEGTMLITRAQAVNQIRKSRGGFFSVSFLKKDKSFRTMLARLGVRKGTKGGQSTVADHPQYLTVWDVHKRSFRNVNVDTILLLRVNGVDYTVTR